jgi:hypothetical protein
LGLATIFYCLTFETSLFVASYDSQGHGGGIRSRLHTGMPILVSIFLLITPLHGPSIKHRFQQYLYCRMHIHCSGNVSTESLSRNSSRRYTLCERTY